MSNPAALNTRTMGWAIAAGAGIAAIALTYLTTRRSARRTPAPLPATPETPVDPATEAEMVILKRRIKEHYDGCSEHYVKLWGQHVHHGLWRPGAEGLSKEAAQEALVLEMYARAQLPKGGKILDVGCGVGGTSIMLAGRGHEMTAVSLSPIQIQMAKGFAETAGANVRFIEMDGEKLSFPGEDGSFDAVWISEALSHFPRKDRFFAHAVRLLKPGGKIVIVDWFAADSIGPALLNGVIADIERGMLLPPLQTVTGYANMLVAAGARPIYVDDISKDVSRTWDICLDLISSASGVWDLAKAMGTDFVDFLHAFRAMRDGFANGAFRFTILIAEKPRASEVL